MTDRNSVDLHKAQELCPATDYAVRQRLLGLFYTTRRKNMKQPGLGITTMEEMMKVPAGSLEFHLWYICEKGWIQREVSARGRSPMQVLMKSNRANTTALHAKQCRTAVLCRSRHRPSQTPTTHQKQQLKKQAKK